MSSLVMRIPIKFYISTRASLQTSHGGKNVREQPASLVDEADDGTHSFLDYHFDSLTDGGLHFLLEIQAVNDDEIV